MYDYTQKFILEKLNHLGFPDATIQNNIIYLRNDGVPITYEDFGILLRNIVTGAIREYNILNGTIKAQSEYSDMFKEAKQ